MIPETHEHSNIRTMKVLVKPAKIPTRVTSSSTRAFGFIGARESGVRPVEGRKDCILIMLCHDIHDYGPVRLRDPL